MDMKFIWIFLIWSVIMIILVSNKLRKEKEEKMTISKKGLKNYDKPLEMSIGERLRRKNNSKGGLKW
jgi:hypothetical protein